MDDEELELSEKILSLVIEDETLPEGIIKQELIPRENWNDPKAIKQFNRIIEILYQHNLISKTSIRSGFTISPGPNARIYNSVSEYFLDLKKRQDKEQLNAAKDEEKRELEITNLKLQISDQKRWIWKIIITAILIELIQFYFLFLKS
jgi:predicted  nucleic acid-binding Zn ribbon protein